MKKIFTLFVTIFVLVGCSNEGKKSDTQPVTSEKSVSLEEQITNVMSENKLKNKKIIDYDIKENYIYAIFQNSQGSANYPDLVILKNENGKLKWVAGPGDRTNSVDKSMIFGREDGPSVTIQLSLDNINVKEVKVLGESAKKVTYVEHVTDDILKEYTYWIAYTNEEPTHEDIEIITE
ncbi:hypothetical protein [Niallia sp. RD1]|uniref:hypothetical protein n=1 Tax=Niallia sp. RD1 TaxID=2962858 RepID=UPI000332A176|nr:hypothetical protein [Niallia sp. RD1]EOR22861.1 hypothetical protein A499_15811 [Niallia nealsonii AAU1]UTI40920.1 hypothetical protein NKG37_18870 [Niallia sp. RD1]